MKNWLFLALAIVSETMATTALKASASFTKPLPAILTVLGYGSAFYFMSLTMRVFPMGMVYAIWSGVGMVLITLLGVVLYRERPDAMTLLGMGLILVGVLVINLFGKPSAH